MENRAVWTRYFQAYDRAVALTAHLGPTLLVPAQDWPTRLSEMQERGRESHVYSFIYMKAATIRHIAYRSRS